MHAAPRQIVVQVGDIHSHDSWSLPFQPNVHWVAIGQRCQFLEASSFGMP